MSGGSSNTTVVNSTPPPTENELEAQHLQLEELRRSNDLAVQMQPLLQQQIAQMQSGNDRQAAFDAVISPEMQAQQALADFQRSQRTGTAQDELLQIQLDAARNGGRATPEQAALIDAQTAAAQKTGESDISRFLEQTLRSINEEAAQAAGLRSTDTPVVRLSERAGEEATRQQGQLTTSLAGGNAAAKLNFPLAAGQATAGIASNASQLNEGALQFQEMLQQRAAANRMQLGQSPFNSGLGLGFTQQQLAGRQANSTQGQSGSNLGISPQEGAGAMSALGSLIMLSDRRLKTDIVPSGRLPSGIGMYWFKYKGGSSVHCGVMADEVLPVIPEAVVTGPDGYMRVNYGLLR